MDDRKGRPYDGNVGRLPARAGGQLHANYDGREARAEMFLISATVLEETGHRATGSDRVRRRRVDVPLISGCGFNRSLKPDGTT
jgi:hypothetical protein